MPPEPRRAGSSKRRRALPDADHLRTYADFVDAALFHPRWGYYSTGNVRFGDGGHYDTYPLALSPLFGRMVAGYAFRVWQRLGGPGAFEICELGAGNGQLCLDVLLALDQRPRAGAAWRAFAKATRYRIVERSPALAARQRAWLGPLQHRVTWTRADLAQRAQPTGFGDAGLIVANEVLDCLPHHRLTHPAAGGGAVTHVAAALHGRSLTDAALARAMTSPTHRRRVRFRSVAVPLERLPALAAFVRRYYDDWLRRSPGGPPLFVAPRVPSLMRNTAGLYRRADALWIDYGAARRFHLTAAEERKAFAGPPRSGRGIYDRPGQDDITFMVDFTLAAAAARDAGWTVVAHAPQGELARMGGVRLDDTAIEAMVRQRALVWMLALAGIGPERAWRRGAVAWSGRRVSGQLPVQAYVRQTVREFLRRRGARFQLLVTRR